MLSVDGPKRVMSSLLVVDMNTSRMDRDSHFILFLAQKWHWARALQAVRDALHLPIRTGKGFVHGAVMSVLMITVRSFIRHSLVHVLGLFNRMLREPIEACARCEVIHAQELACENGLDDVRT